MAMVSQREVWSLKTGIFIISRVVGSLERSVGSQERYLQKGLVSLCISDHVVIGGSSSTYTVNTLSREGARCLRD